MFTNFPGLCIFLVLFENHILMTFLDKLVLKFLLVSLNFIMRISDGEPFSFIEDFRKVYSRQRNQ